MQLALLSAVTYWIANRVASRLQALMGKVCCYVSAWRCGHLRAACNGLRMWCFRLCCRLCFAHATPSRHAHLATSRHLPPPNYYQRRRRARTAPQASPTRTPTIARAKILKSSPLLGSFLGRIFTSWRPGDVPWCNALTRGDVGQMPQARQIHRSECASPSCVPYHIH